MSAAVDRIAPYLFVSHASADQERVRTIASALESIGVETWLDRDAIAGGESYGLAIAAGVRGCAALLLCCSPAAYASRNVRQEIALAWKHERPIVPLLLEAADVPAELEYWLEAAQWIAALDRPESAWLPDVLRALNKLGIGATPDASDAAVPTNLPAALSDFIGRGRELAEVRTLLGKHRLVTLTGAGGAGKTRLAVEAAGGLVGQIPDGVWLVGLAALNDPALVPQTAAAALGLHDQSEADPVEALATYLGPRRMLIVLDNCERLVAASASLAAELLGSCPHLRVLATSREALGVPGEATYRVPSLLLPDPNLPPTALLVGASEAVQLFVERAAEASPGFVLTDQNAAAVARICRRVDGMPLAIELAAARVNLLGIEEMAALLDSSFAHLTGGNQLALPRRQTQKIAIQWSYDLLSEAEQALLARLGVFAGGFTLEEAEAVAARLGPVASAAPKPAVESTVLDLLTRLVDQALLTIEEWQGEIRYGMLDPVRAFALERLAAHGNETAARLALEAGVTPAHRAPVPP